MPRVKIDYVVSFSSEDPDNPASNLLAWDVSKKRWLCAKGEQSCSVVLQLPRAVKISAVQIGAHHAALVEVLVGRSEKPNEPFQVLVPSCIFLTPAESRRETGVERVRSFAAAQLSAAAQPQRWDRVRLVCSQPYNKHCKFGLNFVHITEAEAAASVEAAPLVALPAAWREAGSSSEDEFRPGELFAQHRSPVADTGAQIRQATSQALKNISDSATKLVKTPIHKHARRQAQPDACADRRRDDLMYTRDDDRPHAKIDHIVQRHKDEKSKDEKKPTEKKHDRKNSNDVKDKKEDSQKASQSDRLKDKIERTPKDERKNRPDLKNPDDEPSSSSRDRSDNDRKRSRDEKHENTAGAELKSLLKGVTLVLSGYVHPQRAGLRDAALELGARCERDWGPHCTHLICAFPNTPKLRQVRAAAGGAAVPVVRGEWLRECRRRRRRLPWRWYATEPQHAQPQPQGTTDRAGDHPSGDEDCDTDDEIEKALRKQKKRRTEHSPDLSEDKNDQSESSKRGQHDASVSSTPQNCDANVSSASRDQDANVSNASDVMFVRDERMQGNVSLDDSDDDKTDEEDRAADASPPAALPALPDLFAGRTFAVAASAARMFDAALLERYARAYGGLVLDAGELEAGSSVDYVLCTGEGAGVCAGAGEGARVRPDWLWRCHEARALLPTRDYLLN